MKKISVTEAAKMLKISRQYVWMLIKQNRLPAIRVGKFYVIREEDAIGIKDTLKKKQR